MAFDGLVLNAVVSELKNNLIGGKIQKIYQPSDHEILLGIYANSLQYALSLNISSNCYSIHLTTTKKENPLVAPNFCMLLRKHIMGFRLNSISTNGLERIVTLELTGYDQEHELVCKKLVIELMGKHSNILLLDENDMIIDAFKHFSKQTGANRDIMPKSEYHLPISNKLEISHFAELEKKLENTLCLSDFFVENFIGISKSFILNVLSTLKIEDNLTLTNYRLVASYILDFISKISDNQVKAISIENQDYTLIPCLEKDPLQINFFLDDYYTQKEEKQQFLSYRNQVLTFILGKSKKLAKKLDSINEKLKDCSYMEEYKLYGELLTSYLYQIGKEHRSSVSLNNYYENNTPIEIPLDIALSPSDNAKKYFKKYHKLKNTFSIVQEQKQELEHEISYIESIIYEIQAAKTIKDIDAIYEEIQSSFSVKNKEQSKKVKGKKTKVNPASKKVEPFIYQVDGFKVLVGKNNKQNDELTFKIAKKEDLWFHVKDIHGSHVILITNGVTPSQETINKVASITAYHSKASCSSNVPVDYTFVKYIKKPNHAKPRNGYLYQSENCECNAKNR